MFWRRSKAEPNPEPAPRVDPLRIVAAYHSATKHDFHRYASGPGELDWATQPDPFRRFVGAELVTLERCEPVELEPLYEVAFCAGEIAPRPLSRASLSQLFFDSLALSAWKRYGESRWSLRCNPSSGNLHPTEGYFVGPEIDGVCDTAMIAHYAPREHALEVRAKLSSDLWSQLKTRSAGEGFFVGLTSIHWREAWKYGERAFRYCQHDVGHALGAIAVAAAALGWRARLFDELASDELTVLLGLRAQRGPEAEQADTLIWISTDGTTDELEAPSASALTSLSALEWHGLPAELSPSHVEWSAIEVIAEATRKPRNAPRDAAFPLAPRWEPDREPISLRKIVRGRRSAVSLDGKSGMTRDAFVQTLRRTLPRERETVIASWPYEPRVDLVLFVHRVEGIEPGLYIALRDPRREQLLRSAFDSRFEWSAQEAGELALYRLRTGDVRSLARSVSCHQDIAADGCFSVGMLADLRSAIDVGGAPAYPRLYWECGLIGQLLYLEAEALGLRGTGIGCFFDDAVHRALGLTNDHFQSLYHFTLGAPLDDARISAESAYPPS